MAQLKNQIDHQILERIHSIDKNYLEEIDPETVPTDPDEFLSWWWNTYAKDCQNCSLCTTRNSVVKPDGTAKAKIMIIGEGPGFLEDLSATPLVGPQELTSSKCNLCTKVNTCYDNRILLSPRDFGKARKVVLCDPNYNAKFNLPSKFFIRSSGAIIDGILLSKWKMNYPRQNWINHYNIVHPNNQFVHDSPWFITNITLCRSTDATRLKDTSPESIPRKACKKWLTFQWAAVNPDIIVCLGRVALSVLVGSETKAKSITPNTIIDTKFGKVLFQIHPAAFMREKGRNAKAYGFAKIASTLEKALEHVGLPI